MRSVTLRGLRLSAILSIVPAFLSLLPCTARADRWVTYAYANDENDMVAVGNVLWITTTAGALRYDVTTGAFQQFTRRSANGPVSQDMTSVTYDAEDQLLYFGTADRGVSVYDIAANRWQRFDELPDERINSVTSGRGSVFIATRAGYAIRRSARTDICNDIDRNCCGSSVTCDFPSFDVRDFLLVGDKLWAATSNGPAVHDSLGVPLERFHWQRETALAFDHPPTSTVIDARTLATRGDTLFLATAAGRGVYRWNPDSLSWAWAGGGLPQFPPLGDRVRLASVPRGGEALAGSDLWMATGSGVYRWTGTGWSYTGLADISVRAIAGVPAQGGPAAVVVYAATEQGLYRYEGGTNWTPIRAPGPPINSPGKTIDVDKNGVIWIGTLGGAVSYSPDSVWTGYRNGTHGIGNSEIFSIFTDSRTRVWLGKCCCPDVVSCFLQYLYHDSPADTVAASDTLQAWNGWGLAEDSAGRLWVGSNSNGLEVLDPNGLPIASTTTAGGHLASNSVRAVATQGDRVWVGHENRGVQVLSTGGHPENPAVWTWKTFTVSQIPDLIVSDIVLEGNTVWVLTSSALNRIQGDVVTDRQRLDFDGEPRRGAAVRVDRAGNKWVATNNGVLRFDRNGNIAVYNTDNSDLLENDVLDVAIDPKTGDILFEMQGGTSRLTPGASPPGSDSVTFFAYPNPFRLGSGLVKIGGGSADNARVMDLAGRPVASFDPAQGWNGVAANGRPVAPGIYFVNVGDQVMRLAIVP